jgi:hypothetical protein
MEDVISLGDENKCHEAAPKNCSAGVVVTLAAAAAAELSQPTHRLAQRERCPGQSATTRRDSSLRVKPASADTTPLIRMMTPAVAVSPNSCMERDDISAAA